MTWLLGGGTVAGTLAMLTAVVLFWRQARANRDDLLRLAEVGGELRETKAQLENFKSAVGDLDAAIQQLQDELARERAARNSTDAYLGRLLEDFARTGDPRGAGERMRRSIKLLEGVPGVPPATPAAGSGSDKVHGAVPPRPVGTGPGHDVPGPGGPKPR